MNQDELIEKCRLTDEEFRNVIGLYRGRFGRLPEYTPEITPRDREVAEAQLHKAIPTIEAEARKAERERIVEILKDCQFTIIAPNAPANAEVEFLIPLEKWQALKGEGGEQVE